MPRACREHKPHQWVDGRLYVYCAECGLIDSGPPTERRQPAEYRPNHRPWRAAREANAHFCFWCHEQFNENRPPTFDHAIPISDGGTRNDGLVFSCQKCNGARGSIPFEEYLVACVQEREAALAEDRKYRRPRLVQFGNDWLLTSRTKRELREQRKAMSS